MRGPSCKNRTSSKNRTTKGRKEQVGDGKKEFPAGKSVVHRKGEKEILSAASGPGVSVSRQFLDG